MQKRLDSMDDKINDLTWRLNLEKIRGCFGDQALRSIFPTLILPSETRAFSQKSQVELALMGTCMDLVYEFEKRRRLASYEQQCFSVIRGELEDLSKRLRREDTDGDLSEEESQKPRHIKDMEEERSCLEREYLGLSSDMRGADFSGMTEADRAAEAERLRAEEFHEASRLPVEEGDIVGALR
jgi:hypothetical protein